MKEFEASTFNKETAAQDTERKQQRKISLLLPQFVNCVRIIEWGRMMIENFVTGQILRLTVRMYIFLRALCCLSLQLGVHVSTADRAYGNGITSNLNANLCVVTF